MINHWAEEKQDLAPVLRNWIRTDDVDCEDGEGLEVHRPSQAEVKAAAEQSSQVTPQLSLRLLWDVGLTVSEGPGILLKFKTFFVFQLVEIFSRAASRPLSLQSLVRSSVRGRLKEKSGGKLSGLWWRG